MKIVKSKVRFYRQLCCNPVWYAVRKGRAVAAIQAGRSCFHVVFFGRKKLHTFPTFAAAKNFLAS